ncbi:MAG TPA: 5'-3' exonuclease [Candidatus Dormibacteraeota bacterium]
MAEWLLVDGSSLIFRAFFAIPQSFRGPDGRPNNGIRGFLDLLSRLITERKPRRLAVATDEDWRPQFRVDLIPTYKLHRTGEPVPPLLEPQIPIAYDVLEAAGIAVARAEGYEAEDVIASLAAGAEDDIEIASGDRDLFALVEDGRVRVLYPAGKGVWSDVDEKWIESKYGIPGRSYADFAILRGDPSDGLPGLAGVGEKSAAAMVKRHGSVEGVLAEGKLSAADADYLRKALVVVKPAAGLQLDCGDCLLPPAPADPERLNALSQAHGLDSPISRLGRALGWAGFKE